MMRWMAILAGTIFCAATGVLPASAPDSASIHERVRQEKREKRILDNHSELEQIKLVDSVGWIKVTAIRKPDRNMEELELERLQRKIGALIGFCIEARFEKLAEVDSLTGMTENERKFCRERLKTINPLLQ